MRQANLFSIEWRLPHVAATVRRRAIGPGSERRLPVFRRFRFFHYVRIVQTRARIGRGRVWT